MQIVIDIPDRIYKRQGYLNIIDSDILRNALKNGTPLPKGATNGDMIKAIFPNYDEIELTEEYPSGKTYFSSDWWNAPYKYRKVRIRNDKRRSN